MLWVIVISAPIVVHGQWHAVVLVGSGSGSKEISKGRADMSFGVRNGSSVWINNFASFHHLVRFEQ